mgnify:CR=1 FL=1
MKRAKKHVSLFHAGPVSPLFILVIYHFLLFLVILRLFKFNSKLLSLYFKFKR